MATQVIAVTHEAENLGDPDGLALSGTYVIQNSGGGDLYISETDDADVVGAGHPGHIIRNGETWSFTVSALGMYVWASSYTTSAIITES